MEYYQFQKTSWWKNSVWGHQESAASSWVTVIVILLLQFEPWLSPRAHDGTARAWRRMLDDGGYLWQGSWNSASSSCSVCFHVVNRTPLPHASFMLCCAVTRTGPNGLRLKSFFMNQNEFSSFRADCVRRFVLEQKAKTPIQKSFYLLNWVFMS